MSSFSAYLIIRSYKYCPVSLILLDYWYLTLLCLQIQTYILYWIGLSHTSISSGSNAHACITRYCYRLQHFSGSPISCFGCWRHPVINNKILSLGLPTLSMGNADWLLSATGGGLSLSRSARPVPERLIWQIRKDHVVEMWDMLGDNAAIRHHFEVLHGALGPQLLPVSSRPRIREVTSLLSWISCF